MLLKVTKEVIFNSRLHNFLKHYCINISSTSPTWHPKSASSTLLIFSHQNQNRGPLLRAQERRRKTRFTSHRPAWTSLVAARRARVLSCRAEAVLCLLSSLQKQNADQFLNGADGIDRLDGGFKLVLVLRNPMVVLF